MPTQIQQLQQELISAEARFGKDAPIVKALRQQLDGYRSMEVNRQERFLVGTLEKDLPASDGTDPMQPAIDAIESWGKKNFDSK